VIPRMAAGFMKTPSTISVVIPTWKEAPLIEDAVRWARKIGEEVIVVDAESPDCTACAAICAGAKVVSSLKARGIQLNAGARVANGDVFLFLHADARLPIAGRQAILDALADPRMIGGNFLPRFLPESWFTRFLVPSNDLRRLLTQRYYGDSGIFVRREIYRSLGGFPPFPLMEDYAFSRKIERTGQTAYIRHPPIYVSARRFQGRELRTLLLWMRLQTSYWLGVPPDVLAHAYPDVRDPDPKDFIAACRKHAGFVAHEI
jgi:rSAM/selenodomain-associated transferase 2